MLSRQKTNKKRNEAYAAVLGSIGTLLNLIYFCGVDWKLLQQPVSVHPIRIYRHMSNVYNKNSVNIY
jgi:hypothetical protein